MKSRQVFAIAIQLVVGSLIYLSIVFLQQGVIHANHQRFLQIYSILACLQFLLSVSLWYFVQSELVCPYNVWQLSAFLFLLGQSVFWMFGEDAGFLDLVSNPNYSYNIRDIENGLLITLFAFIAFNTGALIFIKRRLVYRKAAIIDVDIRNAAIFFILIAIVPFCVKSYDNIMLIKELGYKALYYEDIKYGISASSAYLALFIDPGLILYLLYLFYSKKQNPFFVFFVLAKSITELIIGGRSSVVMFVMGLICAYSYLVKKITGRRILGLAILSLVVFQILYAVSITRIAPDKLVVFTETITNFDFDFVRQFIGQMGWSMTPVIQVARRMPDELSARYGESYLFAFLSLIPNLGFWRIHPAAIKSGLAEWLQGVMGIDYGPGFSFIAELYLNYRHLFFVGAFVWGCFWGRIFSLVDGKDANSKKRETVFVVLLLSITTKHFIRSSFLSFFKTTIYYVLFPMLVLWIVYSSRKYRENKTRT
jgi:oligosaccharide repeat unit polymerase